ncbi:MAG TPA: hypothetical protein PLJ21_12030 [Pseudobdellovibrionaceae bacterium]|nr:hypothetical protein [Pseudobdellovibrionaceae bacterium]
MSITIPKIIVLFGFILSFNVFAQDLVDGPDSCKSVFSIQSYKRKYLYDQEYNTRAEHDPQIINLRKFAWNALTSNPDLEAVLHYMLEKGGVMRYVVSDVQVESAGHVDWKELNQNPRHIDYGWAVGLILTKTVELAGSFGYSAPTILSTELTKPEMAAIEILNIGGSYLIRTSRDLDEKTLHSVSGAVFTYKWEKTSAGVWRYVRKNNP